MPTEAEKTKRLYEFEVACVRYGPAFAIALVTNYALIVTHQLWTTTFKAAIADCARIENERKPS